MPTTYCSLQKSKRSIGDEEFTACNCSTDIFGPVEDDNDENVEGEKEVEEEEPEEEQEKEEDSGSSESAPESDHLKSWFPKGGLLVLDDLMAEGGEDSGSSEEEEEADDNEPDPWSPLCQKVGEDLKETYLKEVQQFLDKGKSQNYAENAALSALLPVSKRRL